MGKNSPTLTRRSRRVVEVQKAALPSPLGEATATTAPPATAPPATRARSRPGPPPGGVRIFRGAAPPVEIGLDPRQRYLLGRHDAADIGFDDEAVSRLHGVLTPAGDGWAFEDYGSSNGTALVRDGVLTELARHEALPIGVGDRIELGDGACAIELLERPRLAAKAEEHDDTRRSAAARAFSDRLLVAARTRVPVFLLGPSGCGKTHSARVIHEASSASAGGSFVPVNCARLPQDASALHSELLGHVKGAFTGADAPRKGKLVLADGGTLFLDEVESLSPLAQGFLLDVLEGTGDLAPLGAGAPRLTAPVFRLISASKLPLAETGLRDDLCERLAEGHLWRVPTLVERADDIPGLVARFSAEQSSLLGVSIAFSEPALAATVAASWPGQIRQLRATVNVLAQMAVASLPPDQPWPARIVLGRKQLEEHLRDRAEAFGTVPSPQPPHEGAVLRQKADARSLTASHVEELLAECGGNQSEAARRLGIARNTLARKIREFGLG